MQVKVENLSVRLGGRTIVKDVSTIWLPNAPSFIVGPNGAGKTTLINAITGHVKTSSGEIYVGNRDITSYLPHRRAQSVLRHSFQIPKLPPRLSGRELLSLARDNWRGEIKRTTSDAQALVESPYIQSIFDVPLGQANHSTRKLIEVLSVLISPAPVLLLDEPTAGLSIQHKTFLIEMLKKASDRTLIIVEHDLETINDLQFQTQFMMDGEIVHSGSLESTKEYARKQNVYF